MRRILLAAMIVTVTAFGGLVVRRAAAEAPKPPASATKSDAPTGAATMGGAGNCPMMGGGMMGGGMMGGHMMGGMGPMMMGGATKVDVKKIDKGVTITMTSADAATVTRLQKMAEAMRLMHEAMAQ